METKIYKCDNCKRDITEAEHNYSMRVWRNDLCRECQNRLRKAKPHQPLNNETQLNKKENKEEMAEFSIDPQNPIVQIIIGLIGGWLAMTLINKWIGYALIIGGVGFGLYNMFKTKR